jgi:nitroimidazol reductase NimA-like FMN-containing flavoprotein (pyridoxamine 5'-phosphate oxidase superfamily)
MSAATTGAGAIEILPADVCLRFLQQGSLGRLAFAIAGQPEIFPVNYSMDGDVIMLRTAPGTKLRHAPHRRVAFEIDGVDADAGVAWSVVVKGLLEDITTRSDPFSIARREVQVNTLAPGERRHSLAIYPAEISGRRFPIGAS